MKIYILLIISFAISVTPEKRSLSPNERVAYLKQRISDSIKEKQPRHKKKAVTVNEHDDESGIEYVDIESMPITPIMDFDDRKKHGKFRLRQIKTTPTTPMDVFGPPVQNLLPLRSKAKLVKVKAPEQNPLDSFYRRFDIKVLRKDAAKFIQCQDLLTPLVNGQKNISQPKFYFPVERTVQRLLQLLSINTTTYNKEDIYSVLYQISNLQLRLFQWEVNSIIMLLNVISSSRKHTFRNVKSGLKKLLYATWHLELSDTSNLLRQARIFRPPCILGIHDMGSTKTSKVTRYPKLNTKSTCKPKDKNPECFEDSEDDDDD